MQNTVTYQYEHHYDLPIDVVWKRLSDTNRLHEVQGIPTYTIEEKVLKDNSVMRYCKNRFLGLKNEWKERFGEWVAPYIIKHKRFYSLPNQGSVYVEIKLVPTETGCKHIHTIRFKWTNFLGTVMCKLGILKKESEKRNRAAIELATSEEVNQPTVNTWHPPKYSARINNRVKHIIKKINESTYGHHLGKKIADFVMYSLDIDVDQIRPLVLAKQWNISKQKIIEACLEATNVGLLGMRWDLICPECRIVKQRTLTLHDLPKGVHCSSCNIDFDSNFDQNVELTFFPAKWLREIESTIYCLTSAQLTPHILIQWRFKPDEKKPITIPLKPGKYRCRSLEIQKSIEFEITDLDNLPTIELREDGLHILSASHNKITFINSTSETRHIILEYKQLEDIALTGQKVLAMKVFRDLCPEQLLKPGDDVSISDITIMFTDLKNSTAFYYEAGETKAFHIVREHYSFLSKWIYKNHGTIVKTIGDSVMAAFNEPMNAVKASLDIQKHIEEFNQTNKTNIELKIGLHKGNCIAVNLNQIMDYFGTAVNMAARLHALSKGRDIILSESLIQDSSVNKLLSQVEMIKDSELVKGIAEPIVFYRIIYASDKNTN